MPFLDTRLVLRNVYKKGFSAHSAQRLKKKAILCSSQQLAASMLRKIGNFLPHCFLAPMPPSQAIKKIAICLQPWNRLHWRWMHFHWHKSFQFKLGNKSRALNSHFCSAIQKNSQNVMILLIVFGTFLVILTITAKHLRAVIKVVYCQWASFCVCCWEEVEDVAPM